MSDLIPTDPNPTPTEPQPESVLAPPEPYAAPMPAPPAPRKGSGMRLVAAVAAAVVVATGGGIGIGWNLARLITNRSTASNQIQTVAPVTPSSGANGTLNAVSKVMPAVVDVNTVVQTSNGTGQAAGTGEILDSNGDVLTNNHVVAGSTSIKVTIQGRSGSYTADVIGVDPSADLAVIHIENVSGLPTAAMANSSNLHVGDSIYAVGNALGLGGTPRVTQGQITALDQTITASEGGANAETLHGMIQADAEISPGDSGGALVNSAGQVVGIITAGEATSFRTSSSNVDFAIPSNTAVDVANRILNGQAGNGVLIGPVGFLGVSVQTLDASTASQLGLSVTSGVLVRGVQAGSPAENAGITTGSVITAVNSTVIDSSQALGDALHQFKPGDQVKVTWITAGGSHSATVTLISGPAV
jgi:S1-C subfamily serine protease